jgi:hypothetical protein
MALRVPAIIRHISTTALVSTVLGAIASSSPAHAFSANFAGSASGTWGLPANATTSTIISNQDGGTGNQLSWGLTNIDVPTCVSCTSFNNFIQFNGSGFAPTDNTPFSLGQLTYRNASTTDLVDGQYQTVDFAFPLQISLLFQDATLPAVAFNFAFNIRNTPNVEGDPVASADILSFGSTGRASRMFMVGGKQYSLNLLGFGRGPSLLAGSIPVAEATFDSELFKTSLFAQIEEITNDDDGGSASVCR